MTMDDSDSVDKETMLRDFDLLEQKSKGLAKYASDIIAMVRETHEEITLLPVNAKEMFEWVFLIAQKEHKEMAVKWEFKSNLSTYFADQNFLRLALLNIIQNSIKYCRENTNPEVHIFERTSATSPEDRSVLCIRDFGRGVPEHDLRKIFQPFIRGKDEEKDTGFGLGLSLVTKVITIMGGRVWAEIPEDNGYGTTFCIELPTKGAAQ